MVKSVKRNSNSKIISVVLVLIIFLVIYVLLARFYPSLPGHSLWLEGFQNAKPAKTPTTQAHTKPDDEQVKFHMAGYIPFVDLIISRALHNKLRSVIQATFKMTPLASDQAAQLKNKKAMEADLAKVPKPEDIPKLYTYVTVDAPGKLHVLVSGIKKSDSLAKVMKDNKNQAIDVSKPADSAVKEFDSIYNPSEFSNAAADPEIVARLSDLLKRYPISALDLQLTTDLKTTLAAYNTVASGNSMPLEFLRLNDAELNILGINTTTGNPYQTETSPIANLVAGNAYPESAKLRNQPNGKLKLGDIFNTWEVNFIVSPERKTEFINAEEAAIKAMVMSTFFENPKQGIHISPDRIQVYKARIVSDGVVNLYLQVGDRAGEQNFIDVMNRIASFAIPIFRNLLEFQQTDNQAETTTTTTVAVTGEQSATTTNTTTTKPTPIIDYAITVPIYDFQRIKFIIKKFEKDV